MNAQTDTALQVSVSVTQTLLKAASAAGIKEPSSLLIDANIDPNLLQHPENRIPFEKQAHLWQLVSDRADNENLPLLFGQQSQPASFNMAGYIAMNSQTIGEALDASQTYQAAAGQGGELSIARDQNFIEVHYQPIELGYSSTALRSCAMLTANMALGQWLIGDSYRPTLVHLSMQAPSNREAFDAFFKCPVVFEQPHSFLRFPAHIASTPIPHASLELLNLMKQRADKVIADSIGKQSLSAQVARLLVDSLMGQEPDKSYISEKLGMSQRTLQRKLAKENSSYQEVLDQTRHNLALDYLRQQPLSVSDIAYLLGFAEPSTFYRAFKKWHGMTPGQYREQQR
ncbi:MAG: AraC family transcriptional regulator [Cellvibrionaceae bacterium]